MSSLPTKVYLDVVGCPENRYDVGQVEALLQKTGIQITTNPAEADAIIINTCGLTGRNEKVSIDMIKKVKELAPSGTRVIITGCLPIINRQALAEFKDADIIPGPRLDPFPWDIEQLPDPDSAFNPHIYPQRLIMGKEKIFVPKNGILWILDRILYRWCGICPPVRPRYYVKIATGCNRPCSYCAVRISRGPMRSRPVDWIIQRVKEGLHAGYRTITLIGTNVSGYGQDIGTNLPRLLKQLLELDMSFEIELRNGEPEEVMRLLTELLEVLRTGRITYLEYPLQSGSNRILKLMRRGYTVEEFTHCLFEMKNAAPNLFIRTQVMVGFPTETEEDFEQSLKMVKELPFGYVETFFFSPRPGTKAAEIPQQVDKATMRSRYKRLQKEVIHNRVPSKLKVFAEFLLQTIMHPRYLFKKRGAL